MDASTHSQRMNLVLVDDDPLVLKTLQSAFSDSEFKVTAFEKPLEAVAWIAEHGADIVVSDIYMPDCDGFELLRRVKAMDADCDVIFITALGEMDTAIRALREGATDFFEKPFRAAELRAAMERTRKFRAMAQQKRLLADQVDALSSELAGQEAGRQVMIGQSEAMKRVAAEIVEVGRSTATVLIEGESGVGKELAAQAIHAASARRHKAFLTLSCPSIPEDLFESELFGHRRGAFTGAVETRGGYIEAARGGTLFFDEIGDLPIKSQAKILRLLEQKTYFPVGEHAERTADVRIIAATNRSLEELVREKRFREDLYYRLNVCRIRIPPLRERKDDIPLLALYFTFRFAAEMGKPIEGLENEALASLHAYDYPGNVRELRNIVESTVIHCRHSGLLRDADFADRLPSCVASNRSETAWPIGTLNYEDVERRLLQEALARAGQNVSAAARLLGLSRGRLRRRMAARKLKAASDA